MTPGPRWRRVFRHRSVEREVDDEIAFHIAMREEKLRRLGLSADRAHRAALDRFGDAAKVRDECITIDRQYAREVHLMETLASVLSDFRLAFRSFRKMPAFTAVATITLALGIGATSAMFSLVDGILLRPLPYAEPGRLVRFTQAYPEIGLDSWGLSQENVAMYRDRVHELQSFAGYTRRGATYTGDGRPERLSVIRATGDFFTVLGVAPVLGRPFGRAEDTPRTNDVAVLAYGFWQSHFGGDRNVVGKTIDLDGQPTRIVGVMPASFTFPRPDAQVYLPLGLDPTRKFGWFLTGVARMAPGVTADQVRRSSTSLMWEWARGQPGLLKAGVDPRTTRMTTTIESLRDAITGDSKRPLEVLQAAVVLMLLIAIANVATLLSSRSAARGREMALRNALGATRGRVVRQLLTESVALASLGGVAGIALAFVLVRAITHSSAVSLPRLGEVSVSWRVLGFTLAVSIAAGIAFGLAPALGMLRGGLASQLAGGAKESAHGPARRLNNALVVAQLGLSVVLLISAGLVLKSFERLVGMDLGFDPANVTVIAMPLPARKYTDNRAVVIATAQIVERLRAIPGVRSAAIAWTLPFSGNVNTDGYLVEGHTPTATAMATQTVQIAIGPGYLSTLRIPLRFGRDFNAADRDSTRPVTIVDEALASRYWTGGDAVGKRVRLTGDTTWFTIVGVAGSVRDQDVATEPMPHTYFPFAQVPDSRPVLAIRTDGNPAPAITEIRRTIAELEPGVPLDNIRSLDDWIGRALDTRRITELLLVGFALLAVLLAGVGIYGVMSLYVTNRYREFGIRLAIGAEPRTLVQLVLGEGLVLAVTGVGLGVGGALLATRWLRAILFDVSTTDPVVYTTLAVGLLTVAAASCYLPARRAARSDPLLALRAE
ncbi:MAG: permease [Gemmatimonadetes bacterium]|nr:permease [Gemmatimonadota bacterium]